MKEKEWNRQRDALSAERRKLPMVRIEQDYVFEGLREMPGLSVFLRDGDRLFHTYSTYTRGLGVVDIMALLGRFPRGGRSTHSTSRDRTSRRSSDDSAG